MAGVIANTITVIIGSLIGLLCKKGIPKKLSKAIMAGLGLCVLYIGISGTLEGKNTLVLVISVALGTLLGTLVDIDAGINKLGELLEAKVRGEGIARGFMTASLVFCIGSMTVVGSLQAGVSGDCTTLYVKSLLDFVAAMIFASTLGIGVMFSAAFVFCSQGLMVLISSFVGPFISDAVIAEMVCAGSVIIIGLGLNLLEITKIKVANMMPAIILPIAICPLYDLAEKLLSTLF